MTKPVNASQDRELQDAELSAVTGGADAATPKLYQAACKGTHIPGVTIELW
jgi:type VI protein secretion system component Hcp